MSASGRAIREVTFIIEVETTDAREVELASKLYVVFDIPMEVLDRMESKWERRCNADSRLTA